MPSAASFRLRLSGPDLADWGSLTKPSRRPAEAYDDEDPTLGPVRVRETEHFRIVTDLEPGVELDRVNCEVVPFADRTMVLLADFIDFTPQFPLHAYALSNWEAVDRKVAELAPGQKQVRSAWANTATRSIVVPVMRTSREILSGFIHEANHVLADVKLRQDGVEPHGYCWWTQEYLCMCLHLKLRLAWTKRSEEIAYIINEHIRKPGPVPWDDLMSVDMQNPGEIRLKTSEGASALMFLEDQHGFTAVRQFLCEIGTICPTAEDVRQALRNSTGTDAADLEQEWQTFFGLPPPGSR